MKIVRTDSELYLPTLDDRLRAEGHTLVHLSDGCGEAALIQAVADADILMMCYTPVTRPVIEAAPHLKGILKYGVGLDAIDIEAAKQNGITVVNIPEYAEQTVAEGAFLLMLALLRRFPAVSARMQRDGWVWPDPEWLGRDVSALTIGLIGFGRIGQQMARMCGRGFGARVLAFDPYMAPEVFEQAGVEPVSFEALLSSSDVVSLHTVLNDETQHMIAADQFSLMKRSALLINVSRGGLIDQSALVAALDSGRISGAGLDVFEKEPLQLDDALHGRSNVILLPHLTFWTSDAMQRLEDDAYARLSEMIEDRPVTIRSRDPRLQGQLGAVYPEKT